MKGEQGDAPGAIAAAREPDGIDRRIVRGFEEGVCAFLVGAGEMARGQEALRMEAEIETRIEALRELERAIGDGRIQPRARSDNRDSHAWRPRKIRLANHCTMQL